jgi:glutamate-ammonia-ligase adenylyltransferase
VDWATAVSHIAFRDPEAAAVNLERILELAPAGGSSSLPTLLAESPDPDSALNLFEQLCSLDNREVLPLLERHRFLVHYAIAVFGHSQYLGETLLQNPDLFHILSRDKSLDRLHSREGFREQFARFHARSSASDISQLLARFKRREYVRIMLRDVLGIATLAETTAEISALSDVLIDEALRYVDAKLRNRYGAPRHIDAQGRVVDTPFAVLSLGKLGGNELNYSSDVDLMYLHGDGEPDTPGEISNREYFIRLAQLVTEILTRLTREGPLFRIDLRLRPQGGEGEPAAALGHALRYYAEVAHDWELQALIKVRHSAGDLELAREFVRRVQPFVYRREVNFQAIETALNSREKMGARRRRPLGRKAGAIDVKLDRGGIRDIEFLVQCLQRVYGGPEPWLRSGGTLFSLQKLHDKGHISGKDFHELSQAYEFLRRIEHRMQLRRGQQVHRLPENEADLRVLERAVLGEGAAHSTSEDFVRTVRQSMLAVAEIYQRIIHSKQYLQQEAEAGEFRLAPLDTGREQSYGQILERLALDSPALYQIAACRDLTSHTRRNLQKFLSAAFTSSERYAAVARAPEAVSLALRIFAVSDYLTDILVRHPQEIATVDEIGQGIAAGGIGALFASDQPAGSARDPVFTYLASSSAPRTEKLALLRQHYRHRVFAAGARDVMEFRSVYESLAEMTAAADDAIAAALAIAEPPSGFAVLALGRLGSEEFDVASDADLLFLHDENTDRGAAARTAEQVVQALAAYTRDGTVFAVDARLRPRGVEGELVHTPSILGRYFAEEAQAWEALTYTKLRFVAGSEELAERALRAIEVHLPRFAVRKEFAGEARSMRAKLAKTESGEVNFKRDPGGFYDIDFIVSYLLVRHGIEQTRGNVRERLHGLAGRGLLSDADCATLDAAAELLRTLEHVIRLVIGRARKSLPTAEHARQTTEQLVAKFLRLTFKHGLAQELERTFAQVRGVYDRVLPPAGSSE